MFMNFNARLIVYIYIYIYIYIVGICLYKIYNNEIPHHNALTLYKNT